MSSIRNIALIKSWAAASRFVNGFNMQKENYLRSKVINAFKGFVRTCKLIPFRNIEPSEDPSYYHTGHALELGDEKFEILYQEKHFEGLINCVVKLYEDRIDRNSVSPFVHEASVDWFKQGYALDNKLMEKAGKSFLAGLDSQIKSRIIYVPVEGLKVHISHSLQPLQIARCKLYRNFEGSELTQIRDKFSQQSTEFSSYFGQASAFFKIPVLGHYSLVEQKAEQEVALAFNIIRLFWGSFYFDIVERPFSPRQMGIAGTLAKDNHTKFLSMLVDTSIEELLSPGTFESRRSSDPFVLDNRKVQVMKRWGLAKINDLCLLRDNKDKEVARRLHRTINWFGKATTASNVAESFLLCAVSLEAFLSEGRTPKETYSVRMASLVTRHNKEGIYPGGGFISSEFAEELDSASYTSERFNIVKDKVTRLFGLRNDIAHGRRLEDEINPLDLLDFEVLTRNSILSFIDGDWSTLEEFKCWLNTAQMCAA